MTRPRPGRTVLVRGWVAPTPDSQEFTTGNAVWITVRHPTGSTSYLLAVDPEDITVDTNDLPPEPPDGSKLILHPNDPPNATAFIRNDAYATGHGDPESRWWNLTRPHADPQTWDELCGDYPMHLAVPFTTDTPEGS